MVSLKLVQLLWKAVWHYPNYKCICCLTLQYNSRNLEDILTHMENAKYTWLFITALFEIANN